MCILLVEDEPSIREILAEVLREAGHDTLEVGDGDRAARLIERPPTPFTLLITDLHIPGACNGKQLASLMRRHHPLVPVIFISGMPGALNYALRRDVDLLLPKPFAPSDLLRAVGQVLPAHRRDGS